MDMGGGTPIRLNNEFFQQKVRAIQTVLNGLKHEKIIQICFPIMTPPPPPIPKLR